jgi:hypothetical protein
MAARKSEPKVALTTFAAEHEGREVIVRSGDVLPASSPLVKGREALFVVQSKSQKAGKSTAA